MLDLPDRQAKTNGSILDIQNNYSGYPKLFLDIRNKYFGYPTMA